MGSGGPKPMDVLLADLDFLRDYLLGVAERFRNEGDQEAAELAASWTEVVDDAHDRLAE